MSKPGRQVRLDSVLKGELSRLDRKSGGGWAKARVSAVWDELAGPAVGSHTTGSHIRQGALVIYVDSPIWANELSAMSERYRVAINEALGEDLVKEMRFTVSRKVADKRRRDDQEERLDAFYDRDVVESIPLTEQERAQVEASVMVIGDPELREAVLRATIRDMEWKRGIAARNARETPPESS